MTGREENILNILHDWVGSDEGYTYLLSLAARLVKEVERNGSLASVWPYPLPQSGSGEERSAAIEEVAHDFFLFWAESFLPDLPKHPDLIYAAELGNYRQIFEYARKKFLWQWQEKSRTKEMNPSGYLYRRLRKMLSEDLQFETLAAGNRAFLYRLHTDERQEEFIQTVFQDQDFSSWPILPEIPSGVPEKYLFKADYLKKIALFFWKEACARVDVQAIAVRDLVRYIISQHSWFLKPVTVEIEDKFHKVDSGMSVDIKTTITGMDALAEQLIATWSLEQCTIFLLRLEDPPASLQVIAEKFGWPDHNKVYRLFNSCKQSLITFSSSWPGPPLAELPVECGEIFLEQVKKNAKKRIAARNRK